MQDASKTGPCTLRSWPQRVRKIPPDISMLNLNAGLDIDIQHGRYGCNVYMPPSASHSTGLSGKMKIRTQCSGMMQDERF